MDQIYKFKKFNKNSLRIFLLNRRLHYSFLRLNLSKGHSLIKGKEFEELIAQIEKVLHDLPGVTVQHNVKMPSTDGVERQIDILITEISGRFTYKTVIECKNLKKKVSVNTVGAFKHLLSSVGANQGIIVSSNGFQDGALKAAEKNGILLYQLSEAQNIAEEIKKTLISIYQVTHNSNDWTLCFKEITAINQNISIHSKLYHRKSNRWTTIVEITESFLAQSRNTNHQKMLQQLKNPNKAEKVEGITKIRMDMAEPLEYSEGGLTTELIAFETALASTLLSEPTQIKNVSEYKDARKNLTHAQIIEVEYSGEIFKLLRKETE